VTALLASELRRNLARRLVWVLIGLALVATVIAGCIAFVNAEGSVQSGPAQVQQCFQQSTGEVVCMQRSRPGGVVATDEFRLTDLWPEDEDEGDGPLLVVPIVFLAIGGLLGGASMVGAEWRAGTVATLLTWEPRRVRVAVAKLVAAGLLAFLIALVLLTVFSLAMVPAALRGSTDGADAGWFAGLLAGMLRGGLLTALAATFGAAVAMVGRNTAAALGVAYVYLIIGENIVRAWKPRLTRWLIGENAATFLLGGAPDEAPFRRGAGLAVLTIVVYVGLAAAAAVATFRTRDIAST
jgi:hypothetical protein